MCHQWIDILAIGCNEWATLSEFKTKHNNLYMYQHKDFVRVHELEQFIQVRYKQSDDIFNWHMPQ